MCGSSGLYPPPEGRKRRRHSVAAPLLPNRIFPRRKATRPAGGTPALRVHYLVCCGAGVPARHIFPPKDIAAPFCQEAPLPSLFRRRPMRGIVAGEDACAPRKENWRKRRGCNHALYARGARHCRGRGGLATITQQRVGRASLPATIFSHEAPHPSLFCRRPLRGIVAGEDACAPRKENWPKRLCHAFISIYYVGRACL